MLLTTRLSSRRREQMHSLAMRSLALADAPFAAGAARFIATRFADAVRRFAGVCDRRIPLHMQPPPRRCQGSEGAISLEICDCRRMGCRPGLARPSQWWKSCTAGRVA
jgi:hypothetical protein